MRPFPQNQSGSLHLVLMRCAWTIGQLDPSNEHPIVTPSPTHRTLFVHKSVWGGGGGTTPFFRQLSELNEIYRDVVGRDSSRRF